MNRSSSQAAFPQADKENNKYIYILKLAFLSGSYVYVNSYFTLIA